MNRISIIGKEGHIYFTSAQKATPPASGRVKYIYKGMCI